MIPGRAFWKRKRRKDSLNLTYQRLLIFGLVFLSLVLLSVPEHVYLPVQMTIVSVGAPIPALLNRALSGVASFAGDLYLFDAAKEVRRLREELERARNQILSLRNTIAQKEAQLRSVSTLSTLPEAADLEKVPAGVQQVLGARLSAMDLSDWHRTLIINKGSSSGLKQGMAVTWNGAVLGSVAKAGPHSSVIRVVTDPEFRLWVVDLRSRQQGIWKGTGTRECELSYVPFDADVKEGDWLLTTGFEGIFPAGLPVGRVSRVSSASEGQWFKYVLVQPEVNITALESVVVIKREPLPVEGLP